MVETGIARGLARRAWVDRRAGTQIQDEFKRTRSRQDTSLGTRRTDDL
jgi:hypothetical protein